MNRLLSILILLSALAVRADVTVNRYNISWTLHGTPTYGTYANGDYWVVGPVDITPNPWAGSSSVTSGTMFNPPKISGEPNYWHQGYDNRLPWHTYDDSMNKTGSRHTVPVNTSIVSCLSTNVVGTHFNYIHHHQVLTVVAEPPADGSFRPGIYAASKASLFTTNDINFSKIPSLSATGLDFSTWGNVPTDLDTYTKKFDQFCYEARTDWTAEYITGSSRGTLQNGDGEIGFNAYGEYVAWYSGNAGILLCLNYSADDKRPLLLSYLQYGLDVYDVLLTGYHYDADGAHHCGRYAPLIFTAAVLNNATLKSYCAGSAQKFQELRQTFLLPANCATMRQGENGNDDNTCGAPPDSNHPTYTSDMAGLPEWCFDWADNPEWALNCWSSAYRDQNWGTIAQSAMLMHVLGMTASVNYPALLGYTDRAYFVHGANNHTTPLTTSFYEVYRNYVSGPDTNAPVITAVSTNSISSTNATVAWSTDELSTSGLLYGTTTNYGSSVTNSSLTANHSLTAVSLLPATTYYFRVVSTDPSNNTATATGSFMTDITNKVETPVISPSGYSSLSNITVTMSCATEGAGIYYTVDGSTPDAGDTLYSSGFVLSNSATVKAIGIKSDWTNSAVASESYDVFALPERDASLPTNGMAFLFTASAALTNSSGVTTWFDIGPNARHAVSANAPLRINGAVNSQPAIRFNGTDDYMLFTNSVNGLTGMTIFIVAANLTDQNTDLYQVGKCALFWNELGGGADGEWGTVVANPLQRYVGIRFGTGQVGNSTLFTRASSVGTAFNMICNMHSNTVDRVFTNGILAATWTDRSNTIARCRDYGNIGRGYNDDSFFNGDIAEIIVYERALSGEEKATVETYLGDKYAISGPTAHYPPIAPVFSPPGGGYPVTGGQTNVTVTCDATNVLKFWFTSGSVLSSNTPANVLVTNGQTLNAYATNVSAGVGSGITSGSYTLTNPPLGTLPPVAAYPGTSTNLDGVYVTLSLPNYSSGDVEQSGISGATILWTTNYWESSAVYSSTLLFTNTTTLITKATNLNWNASADAWYFYTITNAPPPVMPTFRRATVRGKFIIRFSWE